MKWIELPKKIHKLGCETQCYIQVMWVRAIAQVHRLLFKELCLFPSSITNLNDFPLITTVNS